jgi:hypothetical protein
MPLLFLGVQLAADIFRHSVVAVQDVALLNKLDQGLEMMSL